MHRLLVYDAVGSLCWRRRRIEIIVSCCMYLRWMRQRPRHWINVSSSSPCASVYLSLIGKGDLGVAASAPGGDVPSKRSGRATEIGRGKAGQTTSGLLSCAWALASAVSLRVTVFWMLILVNVANFPLLRFPSSIDVDCITSFDLELLL